MMKKAYINPTLEVVRIQAQQMLAGSVEGFNSALDSEGKNGSNALGRDYDFDDDEEF